MKTEIISAEDILANVIHSNFRILVVLDRMGIPLGVGNKSIAEICKEQNIQTGAFLVILNLFCNKDYMPEVGKRFEFIPDVLMYLRKSHAYFLTQKIPTIQTFIKQFANLLHNSEAQMVEKFYSNYMDEVTEHIEFENEMVFPYVERLYRAYDDRNPVGVITDEMNIRVYGEQHDDIEEELSDLKNILIRHLPQQESGKLRRTILQNLFELESDLFSHTRIENEVLVPLVKKLEGNLLALVKS